MNTKIFIKNANLSKNYTDLLKLIFENYICRATSMPGLYFYQTTLKEIRIL